MAERTLILKELKKINFKLNIIRGEVTLGTIDNAILALLLMIVSISVAMILLGISTSLASPAFLIVAFVSLMLLWVISQLILNFINSIFFEKRRFSNKIFVIAVTISFLVFLILLILLPYLLEQISPRMYPLSWGAYLSLLILVYGIPILLWIKITPKIKSFFLRRFAPIFLEKISWMDRNDRRKELSSLGITYKELKILAKQ
ncbi:MAG: hypothetical protein KKF50_05520 [Nanoarchaeota archaeon]|nr:hypothetical protein [Nanoarchaeota archaeon]